MKEAAINAASFFLLNGDCCRDKGDRDHLQLGTSHLGSWASSLFVFANGLHEQGYFYYLPQHLRVLYATQIGHELLIPFPWREVLPLAEGRGGYSTATGITSLLFLNAIVFNDK